MGQLERRARRLELSGALGASARSRRLRLYVIASLDSGRAAAGLRPEQLARTVRQLMKREATPLRAFALRSLKVALAVGGVLGVLFGLACALSPGARAYFFPPNLARTAGWQLSSTFPGMPAAGVGAGGPGPLFFHTLEENGPSITLTFPRPIVARSIKIKNREDCCQERALPLNVESITPGGEQLLCQRRAPFQTWTCRTKGVRTQRIRIRHPGPTILHLAEIEVYE